MTSIYRGIRVTSWWFGHTAIISTSWKDEPYEIRVPGEIDAMQAEIDRILESEKETGR